MLANMAELRNLKEAMKGSTTRELFNRSLRHKQIFTSDGGSTKVSVTDHYGDQLHETIMKE